MSDEPKTIAPRAKVRRAVRASGFAAITAAMLPAYAARDALTTPRTRDAVRDRWVRRWSSALLSLFGVEIVLDGVVPDQPGARLVVSNHRSTIDVGVLLRLFGGHMVSRADLSTWPILGAAARKVGTVFVDRADASSGANAIREMRQLLKGGQTVNIFAEGTTFKGDEVRPFHPGAFVAAKGTNAAIVPVGLAYPVGSGAAFVGESFGAHLSRLAAAPATRVIVSIGTPIVQGERVRAVELKDRTQAAVQELVLRARAMCETAAR